MAHSMESLAKHLVECVASFLEANPGCRHVHVELNPADNSVTLSADPLQRLANAVRHWESSGPGDHADAADEMADAARAVLRSLGCE